jgi:hypothetical protein
MGCAVFRVNSPPTTSTVTELRIGWREVLVLVQLPAAALIRATAHSTHSSVLFTAPATADVIPTTVLSPSEARGINNQSHNKERRVVESSSLAFGVWGSILEGVPGLKTELNLLGRFDLVVTLQPSITIHRPLLSTGRASCWLCATNRTPPPIRATLPSP